MKIYFYEVVDADAKILSEELAGNSLVFYPGKLDETSYGESIEIISVFVDSKVDSAALDRFPALKAVMVRATGFDNVDLEECKKRGVAVCNVPAYGASTVAEFTFALLLALARKIIPASERVRGLGKFTQDGLCGMELLGKTLGVFGTGQIGSRLAGIALGFGMKVLACDPFPNPELESQSGVGYVDMQALVEDSDIISLHLPYTSENHHLFNKEVFAKMKPGSLLINTARGGLIDTKALLEAVSTGTLGGAALDVLEYEGFIKEEVAMILSGHPNPEVVETLLADHALSGYPNILLTPHVAYYTIEAVRRILFVTVDNVLKFVSGKPQNLV